MADWSRLLIFLFGVILRFFSFFLFSFLSLFKYVFYLEFHILVVSSLPENATAVGTNGEGSSPFVNKRSHQILGSPLWQILKLNIAFDAARIGTNLLPEIKLI